MKMTISICRTDVTMLGLGISRREVIIYTLDTVTVRDDMYM